MTKQPEDAINYGKILRERIYYIIIPFVSIFVGSIVIALILPSEYKSSSSILIDVQTPGTTINQATASPAIEATVENLSQQLISSDSIISFIERFNLYEEAIDHDLLTRVLANHSRQQSDITEHSALTSKNKIPEWFINKIRKNIQIEMITTDAVNPRTRMPGMVVIGFNVSYEGYSPDSTYNMARTLTSFYLDQNTRVKHEVPFTGSPLIEADLRSQESYIRDIENSMERFKNQNMNYLPDMISMYRQFLQNLKMELYRIDQEIAKANERRDYLMENLDPGLQNLKKMREELATMEASLSPKHPDVIRLKRSIKNLEDELKSGGKTSKDSVPIEVSAVETEIKNLGKSRAETVEKINDYNKRIELAPKVEKEYSTLTRRYESAQMQYKETLTKAAEAKATGQVAMDTKGLVFTLIDPPKYSDAPSKPNRPFIVLIGFILALGTGISAGAFRELSDQSIRSERMLHELSDKKVLAVIPNIRKSDITTAHKEND